VAEARARGDEFCDLTLSNPTSAGIDYPEGLWPILERAQRAARVYRPEALGLRSARQAVAGYLALSRRRPIAAEDIFLSASTSEAYAFLFKLLCDPGDAVLIPAPSYPLFEHLAELEAVRAVPYRLAYDGAWHIDFGSLRSALTPDVRAIVVVSPNNPTGHYCWRGEWAALGELGLPLICDEVFFEYPLEASPPPPPPGPSPVLSFALGGLSKLVGLPQLKLAWAELSGPAALVQEARERLELVADTFLSVGSPIQLALPELLELSPPITQTILARCRHNLATLRRALAGSPISTLRLEGGWSAVLQLPSLQSEDELVSALLTRERVLLQPGWFYDFEREPYAVVSLLTPPSVFENGVSRIATYVTELSR
jgi:aspartate/methionine/tyrosine aminotransferase